MISWNRPVNLREDKALGYLYFMDREHPLGDKKGRVWHHRHVASITLGRWLRPDEVVHHKDHKRTNNDPSNLEVMTPSEHAAHHRPEPAIKPCEACQTPTTNKQFCSQKCDKLSRRKVTRPSKNELATAIGQASWSELGRRWGVSDNAVRKWAKAYGLL